MARPKKIKEEVKEEKEETQTKQVEEFDPSLPESKQRHLR